MKRKIETNIYLTIPIQRVREDAIAGVSLAREAYAEREPKKAAALGIGTSTEQEGKEAIAVNGKRGVSLSNCEEHGNSR